ncbi:protein translocase SecDF, variant type [Mesoplasma seiffertii]|uniref:protein translocase SecDF, variant type n=1 Tax=Mesoplasma seiffertii TaxID=28224 RepID=UPI0004786C07|nr:protein translocase SecDF, variant type [Mesoplasma seiffertii]
MKNPKKSFKKVIHISVMGLIVLSLIVGIIFSSLSGISNNVLGPKYKGGYEALVGVYDNSKQSSETNNEFLPNGDAAQGAKALESKLSPFSDNTIEVTQVGASRVSVKVSRDAYANNTKILQNAIEMNGGILVTNSNYEDVLFNETLMTKAGKPIYETQNDKKVVKEKVGVSQLLGEPEAVSIKSNQAITNEPYIQFSLTQDYLSKIVAPSAEGENTGGDAPSLNMFTSVETILSNMREYYSLYSQAKDTDKFLEAYLEGIIKPLRSYKNDSSIKDELGKRVLDDFFLVNYQRLGANGWENRTASLLGYFNQDNAGFEGEITTIAHLRRILFGDSNADEPYNNYKFSFVNADLNKYIYDQNAEAKEFNENGLYGKKLVSEADKNDLGSIQEVFSKLTSVLFKESLFKNVKDDSLVNIALEKSIFSDNIIQRGQIEVIPEANTQVSSSTPAYIQDNKLSIKTSSYTKAKKAVATILQTTSGLSFKVFAISEFNALISRTLFIVSIVALIILAIMLMIYVVFAYRLLGLFTIIIAAIIGALTFLVPFWFGFAIGPEIFSIIFIIIGLTIDINILYFESIKRSIYEDKHSIESSFKISGRESLWLVIDSAIVVLIPNVILFWIGTGAMKNFATITAIGALFVILFGVVVMRIICYFLVKSRLLHDNANLLPIDTSKEIKGSFFTDLRIRHLEVKIANNAKKREVSSRDLIKTKANQDQLNRLYKIQKEMIADRLAKKALRSQKEIDKVQIQIDKIEALKAKYENKPTQSVKANNKQAELVSYQQMIVSQSETNFTDKKQAQNIQAIQIEKKVASLGKIISIFWVVIIIFGAIIGGFFGANLSSNLGKGQNFLLYGDAVAETYSNLEAPKETLLPNENDKNRDRIYDGLQNLKKKNDEYFAKLYAVDSIDKATSEQQNYWMAQTVAQSYEFLLSNNYLSSFNSRMEKTSLRKSQVSYGNNFAIINEDSNIRETTGWVSITTSKKVSLRQMKRTQAALAGLGNLPPNYNNPSRGILGLEETPYTAYDQIRQIAVMFGILLLALIVYMVIRFKWTYYVALALGLIMTISITVALIVLFRIPVSIEIITAILGVVMFSLVTAILIMGKGKTILASKDERTINKQFAKEIELHVLINEAKNTRSKELDKLKATFKKSRKQLKKALAKNLSETKVKDQRRTIKKQAKADQKALKVQFKKDRKLILKNFAIFKGETKKQVTIESRKNNFLKQIFLDIIKFGVFRLIAVGTIYIAVGIIAAITLPVISGMGMTLAIGVVIASIVFITISVPVWIWLERKRINAKYGYKKFIRKIVVSSEEQTIKDIND